MVNDNRYSENAESQSVNTKRSVNDSNTVGSVNKKISGNIKDTKSDYRYMGLPSLAVDYLRYLDIVKNRSSLTVKEYAINLRLFFRFMKRSRHEVSDEISDDEIFLEDIDINYIKTITLDDAYIFLAYCKNERDNSAKSRSRKISCLRGFFKYLSVQMKKLDENPMQELSLPKLDKTLPKYLTLEQSRTLLENTYSGKFKERDYCIVTFFLNCGLRLSELVGINLSDIVNSDGNYVLTVTGKGSKQRIVYLNSACQSALKDYLKVRDAEKVKTDKDALFLSRHNKRISPRTVQHIIEICFEKAGLSGQGFSTHKLRHTAATLMYQYGNVDILELKEILGHENLSTTEIYTHTADEQLQKAMDANPLSKVKKS